MKLEERIIDEKKLAALRNYEIRLLGKAKGFKKKDMTMIMPADDFVKYIADYALKDICHFDCETALNYLDKKLEEQLILSSISDMVTLRPHTVSNNYEYLVSIVYPKEFQYTQKKLIIDEYEHVNHIGKYKGVQDNYSYGKNFFSGTEGRRNSMLCLHYCIENYLSYMSEEELYAFFADEKKATKFLKEKNLPNKNTLPFSSPLDYFYFTQAEGSRNEFLYQYENFMKKF